MVLRFIRKRLPERSDFLAVLGVVVFVVFGWSVRGFLHEVPSFINYFRVGQILAIFAYMMGFALLESLLATFGLGLLSVLLPTAWFRNGFVYKGFVTIVVGGIAMLWLENTVMSWSNRFPPLDLLLTFVGITLGAWMILLVMSHYLKPLQKALIYIADRIGVMVYLYVPLGVLGLVVVLTRNLW